MYFVLCPKKSNPWQNHFYFNLVNFNIVHPVEQTNGDLPHSEMHLSFTLQVVTIWSPLDEFEIFSSSLFFTCTKHSSEIEKSLVSLMSNN